MTPGCTYRIQLTESLTFDDAAAILDYLHALGVTHLYCSPILESGPGSTHGYDVVDPTRIDGALGGGAGFRRLADAAAGRGMGLVVDIVPNHMATAGRANPWWWDVLTHGPASRYAGYFDVDWHPPATAVEGKVLLGVLGDRYGHELESGALTVGGEGDERVIRYHDATFPIAPETLEGFQTDGQAADVASLDALLQRQHYRLAYWRSAQEELNYRRFFTVDSLIGLRVERAVVFADSHRLILELVAAGQIQGLRVDHVDGLRDPAAYLHRLRDSAPDAYIAVEKILAADERLPRAFPVDGTTGYEFIAAVDGLFVDGDAEPAMTALYHAFSGEAQPYPAVVRVSKQQIVLGELAPDVDRVAAILVDICERDWRHRDRTRRELTEAVREVAIAFGVYRTYANAEGASEEDRRRVAAATDEAARQRPDVDTELYALIRELLTVERHGVLEAEFVARFQQLTPAVMAKGVEDTAFYRYNRLVSLNEVGGEPGTFGRPVARFHEWCASVAAESPRTLLTLSTHDTKRSADVRARINLLAEIPGEWEAAVRRWAELNDRHRPQGFPDRNLEYLAYQTLIGAWPLDAGRLAEFLVKAAREAKTHTTWTDPATAYEDAVREFAAAILADAEFTSELESFIGLHRLVALGRTASLAQTTLLLTCPGVPDLYQGSELWSLDLVDPDNRRPVDFASRQELLGAVVDATPEDVLARSDDGAPKMWLLSRLLRHRRPSAGYTPVDASGTKAQHAVAFLRDDLLVVVPRLVLKLGDDWAGTVVPVRTGEWVSVLTGDRVPGGRDVEVAELLRRFPVAVLERAPA